MRHVLTVVAFATGAQAEPPPFPVRMVEVPWDWPPLYRDMRYGNSAAALSAYEKLVDEAAEPWIASCYESPAMEVALRQVTRDQFDLILIEQSFMGRFLPTLPHEIPKLLDLQNIHTAMARRMVDKANVDRADDERREADRTHRFERMVASQCATCIAVSDEDAKLARALLGAKNVEVVPNGVDTSFFTPADYAATQPYLLYTGLMSYDPNVGAVRHFVAEVLPLIRQEINAAFHIVGAGPTEEVQALASESVIVHGSVPDMRPYFDAAMAVVVPLLEGGGTRLKILEAAASGKAIVSTSLGAEGLNLRHDEDLLIADSAPEFAAAVIRLCKDAGLRWRLGQQARSASLEYDWKRIGARFRRVVESFRQEMSSQHGQ